MKVTAGAYQCQPVQILTQILFALPSLLVSSPSAGRERIEAQIFERALLLVILILIQVVKVSAS